MTTTDAAKDFVAIGPLAGQLATSVRSIERVAERLGLAPAMRLNLVPYFDGQQVEQIQSELAKGK